ncbi:MAG TPA: hypothetical protein DDX14_06840, partial [Cyanobacteria bacterium UBA9579]|nr:hypothetical protein [Cyanobacteria bacterium UBA9579]
MRKIRRKNQKKKSSKSLNLTKSLLNTGIALAVTLNITGNAFAQTVPISDNLPVPNYVGGANLQYNSGQQVCEGRLSQSVQHYAVQAANISTSLNVDLGNTANNVADLRYNSYNIGEGSTVNYNFGAAGQVALNRVTEAGDQFASHILGNISQSGQGGAVFVINPNGILFGANSSVNVDSFMTSTLNCTGGTLDRPAYKTITLDRSGINPRGIYFENGANISTSKSAVFASNGIFNAGADITAGNGNVQLITGDGVTFRFFYDYESQPVSPDKVKPSTVLPNEVTYINGAASNSAINLSDGIVSGHNIRAISRVDRDSNDPLLQLVNLDGVITASAVVGNDSGTIYAYADNVDSTGNANAGVAGIRVNTNLTAGVGDRCVPGVVTLKSDELTFTDSGSVTADEANLKPVSKDKDIFFGSNTLANVFHVDFLDKINASTINIGNETQSNITGSLRLAGYNDRAFDLRLDTTGDVDLNINGGNSCSIIRFSNPNEVTLFGGGFRLADTTTADSVTIVVDNETIRAGKLNAQEDVNITAVNNGAVTTNDICAGDDVSLQAISSSEIITKNIKAGDNVDLNVQFDSRIVTRNIDAGNNVFAELEFGSIVTDNITTGNDVLFSFIGSGIDTGN